MLKIETLKSEATNHVIVEFFNRMHLNSTYFCYMQIKIHSYSPSLALDFVNCYASKKKNFYKTHIQVFSDQFSCITYNEDI